MKPPMLGGVRNALIVAPHADDETIGAHALIRALVRRGACVRVVVVTDGAASHPDSRRWPPARLVRARRDESRRVMRWAGLRAGDLAFLGLPDGGLSGLPPRALRPIARAVARCRADLLVLPAADDDHPDHRIVASAARRAGRARSLEYPVWPAGRIVRRPASGLRVDAAAKRHAIAAYATQMGVIIDDPGGFAISRAQLAAFSRPMEFYRTVCGRGLRRSA